MGLPDPGKPLSRLSQLSTSHIAARLSQIPPAEVKKMLKLALTFFFIGLIAAVLGFTGVAGASFAIAKVFALIFGVLFILFLVLGLSAANRLTT
jgi:uncharacterized membrane protein YtjA (UPF0391 family)